MQGHRYHPEREGGGGGGGGGGGRGDDVDTVWLTQLGDLVCVSHRP